MRTITLPTCSALRHISNNILADVLYYFTSFHGQTLVNIVTNALNKTFAEFMASNPDFDGKVGLVCHSLGGIICYDILAHQSDSVFSKQLKRRKNRDWNAETPSGNQFDAENDVHFEITYPKLDFKPFALFNLGCPLPAVLVMRGQSFKTYGIAKDIQFFNIFHLYDPLAYRLEPLVDARYAEVSPVLLQRPSSNRSAQLTYYKELIAAYLPNISAMNLTSISFPTLESMGLTFPNINFPTPSLPTIPILAKARKSLQMQLNAFYGSQDLKTKDPTSKKRKRGSKPRSPRKRQEFSQEDSSSEFSDSESNSDYSCDGEEEELGSKDKWGSDFFRIIRQPHRHASKAVNDNDVSLLSVKSAPTSPRPYRTPRATMFTAAVEAGDQFAGMLKRQFISVTSFNSSSSSLPASEESLKVHPDTSSSTVSSFDDLRFKKINELDEQLTAQLVEAAKVAQDSIAYESACESCSDDDEEQNDAESAVTSNADKDGFKNSNCENERKEQKKLGQLNNRLDFFVQEMILDNMVHQYLVGMKAHFSYWGAKDVMYHIIEKFLQ